MKRIFSLVISSWCSPLSFIVSATFYAIRLLTFLMELASSPLLSSMILGSLMWNWMETIRMQMAEVNGLELRTIAKQFCFYRTQEALFSRVNGNSCTSDTRLIHFVVSLLRKLHKNPCSVAVGEYCSVKCERQGGNSEYFLLLFLVFVGAAEICSPFPLALGVCVLFVTVPLLPTARKTLKKQQQLLALFVFA